MGSHRNRYRDRYRDRCLADFIGMAARIGDFDFDPDPHLDFDLDDQGAAW
jgi:hypothetical protein